MHQHAISTRRQPPSWAAGLLAISAGLALTALLALAASAAGASTRATVRVGTTHSARLHETILVNPSGRTLYHLRPESAHHIICTGACTKLWPPLLVHSRSTRLIAATGVHGRLSLVRRPNGTLQVAFDGQPLYTFARDHRRGDVNGQDFAGVWFVLPARASQRPVPTTPPMMTPAPTPPTSGGIPQHNGGDMDSDNNGAPSDGDGNQ
jgi:predicted lipoprotein with Yx(FWY)xxD motif